VVVPRQRSVENRQKFNRGPELSCDDDSQSVLSEYSADLVLVQTNAPVKQALGKPGSMTERWRVIYEDPVFSLYAND